MKPNETREYRGIRFTKRFVAGGGHRSPGRYCYFLEHDDFTATGAERERALADMQGIDVIVPGLVDYAQGTADTVSEMKTIIDKNLEALEARQ